MSKFIWCLILSLCLHSVIVEATDGVVEINAACASAGCFPGDAIGYPVVITQSGSYRLTSNLAVVNPSLFVLDVRADDVTIDLNGFSILGPQTCQPGNCQSTGPGHAIASFNVNPIPRNTVVRNGSISGFSGCIVLASERMHIEGLAVSQCTLAGIQVGDDSLVLSNRVAMTAFSGLNMGENTGYRDNVVVMTGLAVGNTDPSVEGGRATGGNICDDRECSAYSPMRRYYLSLSDVTGAQAASSCVSGFHMASIYEIWDVSSLRYDTQLGRVQDDSGEGPPGDDLITVFGIGWVRTGRVSSGSTVEGIGNCSVWTSNAGNGFVAYLVGVDDQLWQSSTAACTADLPVWCIED